jgi:hypothetical protein
MNSIVNHEALDYNEQGRLAPSQMAQLLPRVSSGGMLFLVGGAIAAAITRFLVTAGSLNGDNLVGPVLVLLVGLVLLGAGFLVGGMQFLDLAIGRVRAVDGVGLKNATPHNNSYTYWYHVAEKSFRVYFRGTWTLLPDEISVRAYYTPLSKTLVHVEPVSKAVPGGSKNSVENRSRELHPSHSAQTSLAKIIELRKLRDSNMISDAEFQQKKLELQSRLPH